MRGGGERNVCSVSDNVEFEAEIIDRNSTPEEYKLYDLKTSGQATGTNESYESISETTGLLMRGTEDMHQTMEVVIAKTDGTNDVKYSIQATSHFEMLLVSGSLP